MPLWQPHSGYQMGIMRFSGLFGGCIDEIHHLPKHYTVFLLPDDRRIIPSLAFG